MVALKRSNAVHAPAGSKLFITRSIAPGAFMPHAPAYQSANTKASTTAIGKPLKINRCGSDERNSASAMVPIRQSLTYNVSQRHKFGRVFQALMALVRQC